MEKTEILMKDIILRTVNAHSGIRATELVLKVMDEINPSNFIFVEYQEILEKLIKEGEILELEYTLPEMGYRIKSIYFPKRTNFLKCDCPCHKQEYRCEQCCG